jgi:hypothetical protein
MQNVHRRLVATVALIPCWVFSKAVNAARRIEFQPASVDGKPVSMYMPLEYSFKLF